MAKTVDRNDDKSKLSNGFMFIFIEQSTTVDCGFPYTSDTFLAVVYR